MSNIKEETLAEIKKVAELESLKADNQAKKAAIDNKLYSNKLHQMEKDEKDLEIAKKSNYGALTKEEIEATVRDNDEYMEAAQNPIEFICSTFKGRVPFFRKNLILVGALSGEGKSTAVVNIVYQALTTKNKKTGKTFRTLVITNEEKKEDLYNRVTSITKGWHYVNHSDFSNDQRKEFNRMIPILSADARLTIVDDGHGGSHGVTTSIEGIEAIFESLIANKEFYDIVIIDFYQNIITSKANPGLGPYEVQTKLTRILDKYKNIYPAPIVIMSQLKPQDGNDRAPFQYRLMGSKSIMIPATFAIEMVIDRKNLRTRWIVHKSRYADSMGKDWHTGYDKGRFVPYTAEFAERVQRAAIDKNNGIRDVFQKKEQKDGK